MGSLALGVDAFAIEPSWFAVEKRDIRIRGLGRAFDGYRIAVLSDVHWPRFTSRATLDRAVGLAMDFDPHLIAIPGDICDNKPTFTIPDLRGLFDRLHAPDGVIGSLGNHDHKIHDVPGLRREIGAHTPIELMDGRHRIVTRGGDRLALGAVGDLWYGVVDPVATFRGVPEEVPRIMLSHNPDVAENPMEPVRVDLQLSGHTHGGEFRIPFGPAPITGSVYGQKFREGYVQGRNHPVYVTRGVCSVMHARFFCRPEVTHLTLRSEAA